MIRPGRLDLTADRWVACIRTWAFLGYDLTGAVFAAQVRLTPDSDGAPLIDLATVTTASAEGVRLVSVTNATIAAHIAAGRLLATPPGMTENDSATVSIVGLRINEATMEALPYPGERGDDATFAWDLHVTPAGGIKDKYVGGDFIVRAGVTQ